MNIVGTAMPANPADENFLLVGKGQLPLSDDTLLTSETISAVSKEAIKVGKFNFRITDSTRICTKDGKRSTVDALKSGSNVVITSKKKTEDALTIRPGSALLPMGGGNIVKNYVCS